MSAQILKLAAQLQDWSPVEGSHAGLLLQFKRIFKEKGVDECLDIIRADFGLVRTGIITEKLAGMLATPALQYATARILAERALKDHDYQYLQGAEIWLSLAADNDPQYKDALDNLRDTMREKDQPPMPDICVPQAEDDLHGRNLFIKAYLHKGYSRQAVSEICGVSLGVVGRMVLDKAHPEAEIAALAESLDPPTTEQAVSDNVVMPMECVERDLLMLAYMRKRYTIPAIGELFQLAKSRVGKAMTKYNEGVYSLEQVDALVDTIPDPSPQQINQREIPGRWTKRNYKPR